MITPTTFGTLVRKKNATVRRAMCSALIPARRSAQTPSASPPIPPVGTIALAPSSDSPICVLRRQLMREQKTARNAAQ
jgi:hypothetical protein